MDQPSSEFLKSLQSGDNRAAERAGEQLFEKYVPRLQALVRSRLAPAMARRFDSDDVVQSAMRSFFVRARAGEFYADQTDDLWRLLATITLRKLSRAVAHHQSRKRNIKQDEPFDKGNDLSGELAAREPTPADGAAAAEEVVWLLKRIPSECRTAIQLRFQGFEFEEIALQLKRSERTIRRWMEDAQAVMHARLKELTAGVPIAPTDEKAVEAPLTAGIAFLDPHEYQLNRLIGAGGFCKVYAATERNSERKVCVKVLKREFRHRPRYVHRFLEEFRIGSRLKHSHIPAALGIGRLPSGGYFLVVELIEAMNLQHRLETSRPSPIESADIVMQLAEAVEYIHSQGVIHCDLKPANVLIEKSGKAWLADFGFAREVESGITLSTDGDYIAGTAAYLAPEQLSGPSNSLTPAVDVHGLGAILFALLSGKAPYGSRTLDVIERDEPEMKIDFSSLGDTSPQLAAVCKRCLEPNPIDRFACANDVKVALAAALASGI